MCYLITIWMMVAFLKPITWWFKPSNIRKMPLFWRFEMQLKLEEIDLIICHTSLYHALNENGIWHDIFSLDRTSNIA